MKYLIFIITLTIGCNVYSQASLTVEISSDTIGLEDAVKVTYRLTGAQEKIDILPWEGLQQVSGPNVSSSFSFVNGISSQEYNESYILLPKYEGSIYIPSASVIIAGEALETEPIELFVVAEPNYQQTNRNIRKQKTVTKSLKPKKNVDDEAEYQRLLKKRELAKKKKKF